MAHPGEYGTMLNEMLQNNGINQKIKVPDSPDSFRVFGALGPNVSVPGTENTDQDAADALDNDSINTSTSTDKNRLSSTRTSDKSNVLSSTTSSLPFALTTPVQSEDEEIRGNKRDKIEGALTRESERLRSVRESLGDSPELVEALNVQIFSTEQLNMATTEDIRLLHKKKKIKICFSALPSIKLNTADVRGLLLDRTIQLAQVTMVVSLMTAEEFSKISSGPIPAHVRPSPQHVDTSPKGKLP
jgi:hypothetical protein